ncbi:MAG: DUF1524 domain-containing protein [Gammaproteobacteria bacterium]|nr:DUF1524 domain-containing protein [Gammaproteobacteria bacterium]
MPSVFDEELTSAKELSTTLRQITPSDGQFVEAFEIARVSKAQLARYLLRSLEMAAKEEAEPWYMPTADQSVVNSEHVLPQKPAGNWPGFDGEEM